eukprot:4149312-Lingulodinium_polyedra.AAC.1
MKLIMFGPPGFPWKIPNIREAMEDLHLNTTRMRLCHFGERYVKTSETPSGSYLQVSTNVTLPKKLWPCNCGIPIQEHALDWYGKTHDHAEWRHQIRK